MREGTSVKNKSYHYDRVLLFSVFCLLALGLLMVASSSIVISEKQFAQPFHYLFHQCFYVGVGAIVGFIVLQVDSEIWYKNSFLFLLLSFVLLLLVLVPGIGRTVNGSTRWLSLGPFRLQVSEIAKLSMILFLSGYLVRRGEEIRTHIKGFIKPMVLLGLMSILLLAEPDFGAAVVIMATALGMMFLSGVRLWQFAGLLGLVGSLAGALAITSPYRLARLTGFLNPWANQYDSGYQLTQSLIAFGRGGWLGVGLGESVQKLFYLPEAHTDFLFAVIAEELGLLGILAVIILFCLFVWRAFKIGRTAMLAEKPFLAYVAYGFALWVGLQAFINIGVNMGVLPTKGLTLPFMSYGGSSLLVMCVVAAMLFRIDYECRCTKA